MNLKIDRWALIAIVVATVVGIAILCGRPFGLQAKSDSQELRIETH